LGDKHFYILYCYSSGGDTAAALADSYDICSLNTGRQYSGLGGVCALWVLLLWCKNFFSVACEVFVTNVYYSSDVLQPDLKRDWKNFCDYIKDKCSQLDMDKTKVA